MGDDLVFSRDFSSTSDTFAYDDAGNLVKDSQFIYTYDAWHRLVTAVSAEDDDITVGTYTYDALGRRIKKVVTNAGDLDGTELYFYGKGHQVIEVRDGSENMIRQVVHGTRYIDEVVLEILEDGVAWVHQDANYNVIALTDFASQTLEHTYYTPYGIQTVDQETYWGDYDGDGLVTAAEANDDGDGNVLDEGDTCYGADPSDECRIYDFDFDGDVDATDSTKLATLISATTYRQPGQPYSAVGNTRAHQGLIYDAEIGSYQNRYRQYAASLERFMQRDPLTLRPVPGGGYHDGMSLVVYVQASPFFGRDPSGLKDVSCNSGGIGTQDDVCDKMRLKWDEEFDTGVVAATFCCGRDVQGQYGPLKLCAKVSCYKSPDHCPLVCPDACREAHEAARRDHLVCWGEEGCACMEFEEPDRATSDCAAWSASCGCHSTGVCSGEGPPPGNRSAWRQAYTCCNRDFTCGPPKREATRSSIDYCKAYADFVMGDGT